VAKTYAVATLQAALTTLIALPIATWSSQAWWNEHMVLYYIIVAGFVISYIAAPVFFMPWIELAPSDAIYMALLSVAAGIVSGLTSAVYGLFWVALTPLCVAGSYFGLCAFVLAAQSDLETPLAYIFTVFQSILGFGVFLAIYENPVTAALQVLLPQLFGFFSVYDIKSMVQELHPGCQFTIDDAVFGAASLNLDVVSRPLGIVVGGDPDS